MEALIPDVRIFVPQLLLFFAAYFLLGNLLFKPYLEMLAARDARSFGAADELAALSQGADALQAEIDAALASARDDGAAAREVRLGAARSAAAKVIAEAQQASKAEIEAAWATAEGARAQLRSEVAGQVEPLVATLSSRLTNPGKAA